jgi:hypothetical protein
MAELPTSRRKSTRYRCTGGVELRRNENSPPLFANLSDISLEGCYIEAISTLAPGAELLFRMRVNETQIRGRARVQTSHHAVGMGLEFLHLSNEDQQKLDFLVGTLAGTQELQAHGNRVLMADPPPLKVPPVPATRSSHLASMTPPTSQSLGIDMTQKIMKAIAELNELEQNLVRDRIDPRLIAQLHDSVEHVRQTAFTVQQWVDLSASGGDPFEVLPQLEAERMHMLSKLAHNVTADIDSTSINHYTLGISELFQSVDQLHRRLKKMLLDDSQ